MNYFSQSAHLSFLLAFQIMLITYLFLIFFRTHYVYIFAPSISPFGIYFFLYGVSDHSGNFSVQSVFQTILVLCSFLICHHSYSVSVCLINYFFQSAHISFLLAFQRVQSTYLFLMSFRTHYVYIFVTNTLSFGIYFFLYGILVHLDNISVQSVYQTILVM